MIWGPASVRVATQFRHWERGTVSTIRRISSWNIVPSVAACVSSPSGRNPGHLSVAARADGLILGIL